MSHRGRAYNFRVLLQPTLSHCFVRLLHEKNLLLRCVSSNVDGLETVAGLPAHKVCQMRASVNVLHCNVRA